MVLINARRPVRRQVSSSAAGAGLRLSSLRPLLIPLLLLPLLSCTMLNSLRTTELDEEIGEYQRNIRQWNSMAAGSDELEPLSPVSPRRSADALPALQEINTLFRISFAALAANTARSEPAAPHGSGPALDALAERLEPRTVKIFLDKGRENPPPFVKGLLLSHNGWTLTVQHPFSLTEQEIERVYATIPGREGRFPMELRGGFSETNLLLVKFELPFEGKSAAIPTLFAAAEPSQTAYLAADGKLRKLRIVDTERELMLGDKKVFRSNLIADTDADLSDVVSGSPLLNEAGEILGLYYLQSEVRGINGFATPRELPSRIAGLIARYQRQLSTPYLTR